MCVCFLQAASESEHCITKREHEKCMEMIALHDPSEEPELGKTRMWSRTLVCMCLCVLCGENWHEVIPFHSSAVIKFFTS